MSTPGAAVAESDKSTIELSKSPASAAAEVKDHQDRLRSSTGIDDKRFIDDLDRLKKLRSFLIQEAVPLSGEDSGALSFGRLNLLQYRSSGRAPTQEEWTAVEGYTQSLFRPLTEPLRRRFLLGEVPRTMSYAVLALALIALAALIMAVVAQKKDFMGLGSLGASTLPFYLLWLMSLGAIGSIAFIGMNALSVQQDLTFDLTNKTLILLRIVLGALFGLVLTLPFGLEGFIKFIEGIYRGGTPAEAPQQTLSVSAQATFLLLPFVLGFSTSLVITILNRVLDAVQAFFGRTGAGGGQPPPTSPARSSSGTAGSR